MTGLAGSVSPIASIIVEDLGEGPAAALEPPKTQPIVRTRTVRRAAPIPVATKAIAIEAFRAPVLKPLRLAPGIFEIK